MNHNLNLSLTGKYQKQFKDCFDCRNSIDTKSKGKYRFTTEERSESFCAAKCLDEFKANQEFCFWCSKAAGKGVISEGLGQDKSQPRTFCNQPCCNDFGIFVGRKKAATAKKRPCDVCSEEKVMKAKLIDTNGKSEEIVLEFCAETCMSAYKYAKSLQSLQCDLCTRNFVPSKGPLVTGLHEGTELVFCSLKCRNYYMVEESKSVPCCWCKYVKPDLAMISNPRNGLYFCCTNCLYMHNLSPGENANNHVETSTPVPEPKKKDVRNKGIQTRVPMANKGVTCRPARCHKGVQTEGPDKPVLVPIPVPIYIPVPMQMYTKPVPIPIPMPLPIPVPVFIPTTRNTTRGIRKAMKKIKSKMPANVFEAQLLEMAGAIGDNDGLDSDDSQYEQDFAEDDEEDEPTYMRKALKIPADDMESVIKAGNIVPKPLPQVTPDANPPPPASTFPGYRLPQPAALAKFLPGAAGIKRRISGEDETSWAKRMAPNRSRGRSHRRQHRPIVENNPALAALSLPPKERPDAKHHLKFTYGVNAWRHWVVGKNAELEKARAQGKYMKAFETDILKLRADELNYTLCMFVKEVKKPNGEAYASDSILYLTLGIQEYLFENGRIDNIFTDMYYEPFTSALHEVIKDFKLPVNEIGYFVTRIEEEHLWESKQLGAHSPQVLLNTLVYFNAKFFMMKNLDDHTKLSFTHIMKHWKKNGTATPATKGPAPGPGEKRATLLRYYPPAHLKGKLTVPSIRMHQKYRSRQCYESIVISNTKIT